MGARNNHGTFLIFSALLFLSWLAGCSGVELATPTANLAATTAPLSATPTASVTALAKPGVTPTATAVPTAALRQNLTIPHWFSVDYPAGWIEFNGATGFVGIASGAFDLAGSELPAGNAAFIVAQVRSTGESPLGALQEAVQGYPATAADLSRPATTTFNGLPAATTTFTIPLRGGARAIVSTTMVRAPDGRYAELRRVTRIEDAQQFASLLARIEASFRFEEMHPEPTVIVPAPVPHDSEVHPVAGSGYKVYVPRGWLAFEGNGLLYTYEQPPSANRPPVAYMFAGSLTGLIIPGAPMPRVLDFVVDQFLSELSPDIVRISPVATDADEELDVARAYFRGTVNQRPSFIIAGVVRRGAHQYYGIAILHDPDHLPLSSLSVQTAEEAVAGLVPDPELLTLGGDSTADWSPDGSRLLFSSARQGEQQIYVMDASGQNLRQLTDEPLGAMQGDWSPEGDRVAYVAFTSADATLIVRDVASGERDLAYAHPDGAIAEPDWSPDARSILFTLRMELDAYAVDLDGMLYVLELDLAGNPTARSLDVRGASPVWSPDASRIAFISDLEGQPDLYVMDADGGNMTRLTEDPVDERYPAWSPDGGRIAYARAVDESSIDLYTITVDGADIQRLTHDEHANYAPAWSPDGSRIVFDSNREGSLLLYAIPASGGEIQRLSPPLP